MREKEDRGQPASPPDWTVPVGGARFGEPTPAMSDRVRLWAVGDFRRSRHEAKNRWELSVNHPARADMAHSPHH